MMGSVFIESATYSVREQDGFIAVTMVRTGDTSGAVNITYDVNPFTALAETDFEPLSGSARLEAGETSLRLEIPIVDDDVSEPTELFNVSLVSVDSGALLFPRTANVSILDDENPAVDPANPPLVSDYTVEINPTVQGLALPITVEWLPGSQTKAIAVELEGRLVLVDTETGAREGVLLDIRDQVNTEGDRGLLDIALHPDFENNPFLYAFYVVDPGQTPLARRCANLVQ